VPTVNFLNEEISTTRKSRKIQRQNQLNSTTQCLFEAPQEVAVRAQIVEVVVDLVLEEEVVVMEVSKKKKKY